MHMHGLHRKQFVPCFFLFFEETGGVQVLLLKNFIKETSEKNQIIGQQEHAKVQETNKREKENHV